MLLVHIGIAIVRQFQFITTAYVNSINECFFTINFFPQTSQLYFLFQYNEHVEMNKFMCSLACTLMTILDCQFYIIGSLSLDVSLE